MRRKEYDTSVSVVMGSLLLTIIIDLYQRYQLSGSAIHSTLYA